MMRAAVYIRRPRSRAIAAVEIALVLPLVCLMLFAIIEFGLLFKDALVLQQATREACRFASVGGTPDRIEQVLKAKAPTLHEEAITVSAQFRVEENGEWGDWQDLGYSEDNTQNDAPPGAQIRVIARYRHPLVTGGLVGALFGSPDSHEIPIGAVAVTRRE